MKVFCVHATEKVSEPISWPHQRYDEAPILDRELDVHALYEPRALRKGRGNADRKAIGPTLNSSGHVYTRYLQPHGRQQQDAASILGRGVLAQDSSHALWQARPTLGAS